MSHIKAQTAMNVSINHTMHEMQDKKVLISISTPRFQCIILSPHRICWLFCVELGAESIQKKSAVKISDREKTTRTCTTSRPVDFHAPILVRTVHTARDLDT